jgi:hypothetical protein
LIGLDRIVAAALFIKSSGSTPTARMEPARQFVDMR